MIFDYTLEGLAHAIPGEPIDVALIVDRSRSAVASKGDDLRTAVEPEWPASDGLDRLRNISEVSRHACSMPFSMLTH